MSHTRKYTINSGNEIDYVSTNIVDHKLCVVTYQSNNIFCSKIIELDKDETKFIYKYIDKRNKDLLLLTYYNPTKLSKNKDINFYFNTLL